MPNFKATEKGRLDVLLANETKLTRSHAGKLIEDGVVTVNGALPKKSGVAVKVGDEICYEIPALVEKIEKKDIPVEILYEDGDLAVINKPQGLTVHPAGGNYTDTLVNALMYKLDSLSGINGEIRPGIVHRLDKDTSGVMVVAKNDASHLSLSAQIKERTVKKEYLALLEGNLPTDSGTVRTNVDRSTRDRKMMAVSQTGREAITDYKVITRFKDNCLTLFRIHTGRTHQIRVHAKYLNHPVVGDKTYGYKKQKFALDGQLLHAYRLTFTHPTLGKEMTFVAPLPEYFIKVYDTLASKENKKKWNEMDTI